MESKIRSSSDAVSEKWDEGLTCWRTTSGPQCLRVETSSEIHLFPYGYFQHAKLCHDGNKDVLQIQFQDQIVVARGKGLEPLCAALERLAVEKIRALPEKYDAIAKNRGVVDRIEIVAKSCSTETSM